MKGDAMRRSTDRCLAFVLGGGGARGAMQVGAVRALIEAGYQPDLLVGTSVGAGNAAALALWGVDPAGVDALEQVYKDVTAAGLMDPRLGRLILRALAGRPNLEASRRMTEFFVSRGIAPDLTFDQLTSVRLALVGADLNRGCPVIYGQEPGQSVLEGLLASTAIPPWFAPLEKDGRCIVDGGAVSGLPIEPALRLGATEIIALDLSPASPPPAQSEGLDRYLNRFLYTISQRQACLEAALAEARGVPVRDLHLRSNPPVRLWEFGACRALFQIGYEIAAREIETWASEDWIELPCPEPADVRAFRDPRPVVGRGRARPTGTGDTSATVNARTAMTEEP